jgi:hypothetical protein
MLERIRCEEAHSPAAALLYVYESVILCDGNEKYNHVYARHGPTAKLVHRPTGRSRPR